MCPKIESRLVKTLGGVAVLATVEARLVHADVPARDATAGGALGRILFVRDIQAKRVGNHGVVNALAGANAERSQVDLLSTADDVHAVGPGKFGQIAHQTLESPCVAGLCRNWRSLQSLHPVLRLSVSVYDANHRSAGEAPKGFGKDLEQKGDFSRIHAMPESGQDVCDDRDARLVVLRTDYPYSKDPGNAAVAAAQAILEMRGNTPRLFQNSLVFLAADKTRLQDLDEAARKYLAWQSILVESETLDLAPQQVKQAETQLAAADSAVTARIPETYQWLLAPVQATPQSAITWEAIRLAGQDALAVRASKKLRSDELLLTGFAASRLRMELDRVPLWRGDHVSVAQLAEDFARYVYLPRLKHPSILVSAVSEGVGLMTWEQDGFAYSDSFDESAGRYRGLRRMEAVSLADADSAGLVVRPEVANRQLAAETTEPPGGGSGSPPGGGEGAPDVRLPEGTPEVGGKTPPPGPTPPAKQQPKRFHGTVSLDSSRVGRDASRIADEVIAHLAGLVGAKVTVTLEISADIPAGVPDHVVRTVTENSRTLKFTSQGFEKE